jgi:hypothetical protein
MLDRFARYAMWGFGAAVPLALATAAFGPVAFVRGLGLVALGCSIAGFLVNRLALHAAQRGAYGQVPAPHETESAPAAVPPPFAFVPARLPSRMVAHA